MFKLKDFFKLLRVEQWYKNIVIFIPIIFSLNFLNGKYLLLTILGFLSLCFLSSSYYIINDIVDLEKDKNHPEKKKRPLALGIISKKSAGIISLILFFISIIIGYFLSIYFFYLLIVLFSLSQLYTFYIRKIEFLDIIVISINFVIKAVCGAFIINVPSSYWVILCIFFISLFLVSLKRSSETALKNVEKYRSSIKPADKIIFDNLSIVSLVCTFVFFCIYSILHNKPGLLLGLPLSLYIVFDYLKSTHNNPDIARNPEKFIFNKKTIIVFILWGLITIISFYIYR